MTSNSKKKRINNQFYAFVFACFASLLGLFFYILCSRYIRFPDKWFPKTFREIDNLKIYKDSLFLFFSGINIHLQINIFLGLILSLIKKDKMDNVKFKKWKFWISKILVFIFSLIYGLSHYWNGIVQSGWTNIFLLGLIITVINCCLIELLIQLMNQYGICNAFNLILITEFVPFSWLQKNLTHVKMIWLVLITVFFVWVTNLKWEVPIETNTLYSQGNKLLKKSRSKLGFRLSLSFIPLIHLSTFIGYFYNLALMRKKTNWGNVRNIAEQWQNANFEKIKVSGEHLRGKKGFWYCFFAFTEQKWIFNWGNLKDWLKEKKWIVIGTISFLIFLRWLVVWIQARKIYPWKTKDMSKDLRNKGIYINRIAPGVFTRALLKKVINKLVLFWSFMALIFNIIFDNIFYNKEDHNSLNFMNWFGGVNIGIDLIRQIRTKFKYIKTNR